MAWDDTKQAEDDFTSEDWNDMVIDQKSRLLVTTGAGVPGVAPTAVGNLYVDTTGLKLYFAAGTSAASDWKKVVTQ